ncbi:hypothetical protein CCR75_004891 [Bremia lactucae]|uniref:Uncharacterized protein n=1 Tax=Bremia lactucae TaxID=4779 RepID=A0A976IBY2_BRELC|nr:hypothetical protein CCR75_004891 [Bremia lactucae]
MPGGRTLWTHEPFNINKSKPSTGTYQVLGDEDEGPTEHNTGPDQEEGKQLELMDLTNEALEEKKPIRDALGDKERKIMP